MKNRVELLKQQLQKEKDTIKKNKSLTKEVIQKKIEVNRINRYVLHSFYTETKRWFGGVTQDLRTEATQPICKTQPPKGVRVNPESYLLGEVR